MRFGANPFGFILVHTSHHITWALEVPRPCFLSVSVVCKLTCSRDYSLRLLLSLLSFAGCDCDLHKRHTKTKAKAVCLLVCQVAGGGAVLRCREVALSCLHHITSGPLPQLP